MTSIHQFTVQLLKHFLTVDKSATRIACVTTNVTGGSACMEKILSQFILLYCWIHPDIFQWKCSKNKSALFRWIVCCCLAMFKYVQVLMLFVYLLGVTPWTFSIFLPFLFKGLLHTIWQSPSLGLQIRWSQLDSI